MERTARKTCVSEKRLQRLTRVHLPLLSPQTQPERVEGAGELRTGLARHNVDDRNLAACFERSVQPAEQVAISFHGFNVGHVRDDREINETGDMQTIFSALKESFRDQPRRSWLNFNGPLRRILRDGTQAIGESSFL